jgi:5-methylthioadenosine/S-adenosylhomocysteine deaminase
MTRRTVFRNASWLVAWEDGKHVYRRDIDLVVEGDAIVSLGVDYEGSAHTEIDCSGKLLLPGFVNIHAHPSSEPLRKGITDESRSAGFWHSSLYEFLPVFRNDPEGMVAALQVALAELLMSGVTTVVDLSFPYEHWLDTLARSGIRAVAAPMFRDGQWSTPNGHELVYDWDMAGGRKAFETACRTIELANQHPSGRLSGMICPAQIDTCSAELLRDAYDYASERNLPFQTHAAQSINEFHEIFRRTGLTPVGWLESLGVLSERSIIGHGIFLDHHPWLHWTSRDDLDRLRDAGATVAHCPTVFMRRGISLHTLGSYIRHGVNIGLGTDTYPHNFLEEMRNALSVARAVAGTVDDITTAEVYDAATVGGAHALKRPDLGRLVVGGKADIVIVDTKHPAMMPLREPIRSLIYVAAERAVRDVWVGGEQVVADGKPLLIDYAEASEALERAQARSLEAVSKFDWAGRTADELVPMVLPVPPGW